jgi:hypothetical protein
MYTTPKLDDTFYAKDNAMGEKQTMIVEEPHEECNINLSRDATTKMDISTIDEVIENTKVVELESNDFETVKEPERISIESIDQQQTVLCQGSEQQHE